MSSLSLLTNGSTESLPREAKLSTASSLRHQLDLSSAADPLDVLHSILGAGSEDPNRDRWPSERLQSSQDGADDVDFCGLSLQEFVDAPSSTLVEAVVEPLSFEECMLTTDPGLDSPYLNLHRRKGEGKVSRPPQVHSCLR